MATNQSTIQKKLDKLKALVVSQRKGDKYFDGGRLSKEFITNFLEAINDVVSDVVEATYIDIDKKASSESVQDLEDIGELVDGIPFDKDKIFLPTDNGKRFIYVGDGGHTGTLPDSALLVSLNYTVYEIVIENRSVNTSSLTMAASDGNIVNDIQSIGHDYGKTENYIWQGDDTYLTTQVGRSPNESFWGATIHETFDARESSDGVTVTLAVEKGGGGDLTLCLLGRDYLFSSTPAATIELVPGTNQVPKKNYVYIPATTKILTLVSADYNDATVTWPTELHIKVAFLVIQSAANLQAAGGGYVNQNWNDHYADAIGFGHVAHIGVSLRRKGANWFFGCEPNGLTDYLTIGVSDVRFICTAGIIDQFHEHIFLEKDSNIDKVHIVNWLGDEFHVLNNLYDITEDALGATIAINKWFTFFVWGVANKTGQHDPLMISVPDGTYTLQADAENDVNGYNNESIPRAFARDSSTGFPICRITVQKKATTWAYGSYVDLRGGPYIITN